MITFQAIWILVVLVNYAKAQLKVLDIVLWSAQRLSQSAQTVLEDA